MTIKDRFQGLAARMVGDRFDELAIDTTITISGQFDNLTQTAPTSTQTVPMIPAKIKEGVFQQGLVSLGDSLFICERQKITTMPTTANASLTRQGVKYTIIAIQQDAADAVVKFYVRRA